MIVHYAKNDKLISVTQFIHADWIQQKLRLDEDDYYQNVFCKGLGCGVSAPRRHLYALLDRDSPTRSTEGKEITDNTF